MKRWGPPGWLLLSKLLSIIIDAFLQQTHHHFLPNIIYGEYTQLQSHHHPVQSGRGRKAAILNSGCSLLLCALGYSFCSDTLSLQLSLPNEALRWHLPLANFLPHWLNGWVSHVTSICLYWLIYNTLTQGNLGYWIFVSYYTIFLNQACVYMLLSTFSFWNCVLMKWFRSTIQVYFRSLFNLRK